jgi:hypothetical protein
MQQTISPNFVQDGQSRSGSVHSIFGSFGHDLQLTDRLAPSSKGKENGRNEHTTAIRSPSELKTISLTPASLSLLIRVEYMLSCMGQGCARFRGRVLSASDPATDIARFLPLLSEGGVALLD